MWLRVEIDLSEIPEHGEPNEAVVILRELANWLEARPEPFARTNTAKLLRNFESVVCGKATIQ
jgi:hypothetical protein